MPWNGSKLPPKVGIVNRTNWREFKRQYPIYKEISQQEWTKDCEDIFNEIAEFITNTPFGFKLPHYLGWLVTTSYNLDTKYGTKDKSWASVAWFKSTKAKEYFWSAELYKFKANRKLNRKVLALKGKIKYNHYDRKDFSKIRKLV